MRVVDDEVEALAGARAERGKVCLLPRRGVAVVVGRVCAEGVERVGARGAVVTGEGIGLGGVEEAVAEGLAGDGVGGERGDDRGDEVVEAGGVVAGSGIESFDGEHEACGGETESELVVCGGRLAKGGRHDVKNHVALR